MTIDVHRLSYGIGAEIRGIDLRRPLDEATVAAIRRAWLDHNILVFRGQDITPEEHIRFSRYFGPVEDYPLVHYRLKDHPEIFLLSNRDEAGQPSQTRNAGRHWHSDLSFTAQPAMGSILRCIEIPDVGGNTLFANQYLAYDTLSPRFQALIDDLWAVHELFSKTKDLKNLDQGQVRDMKKANPRIAQPVVRVHPETGRKALYVSVAVTTQIVGMTQEESDAILEFLFAHQTQVQFTYRHAWRPHDIVMWDNRCTLHMAVPDNDHQQARVMHRTTLSGTPSGRILNEDQEMAAWSTAGLTQMAYSDAVAMPAITPAGWISYWNTASRVLLKPNAIDDLPKELDAIACRRVMVVCGGNTRRGPILPRVMAVLGARAVHLFDRVVEHSSTALVTEGAAVAREHGIDGLVAVGGGSASDTAKGIAILLAEGGRIEDHASSFVPPDKFYPKELHQPKLPVIAIPTTASAAEVTPGLGIRNEQGAKLLFWDVKLASRIIILDPVANTSVPAAIMAATAMNGFAHCAEGLYSRLRNPISEAIALHGIRLFTKSLPAMVAEPDAVDHRAGVLAAAHLSGMVISNARVGIHHAVCHCLGARGGLSHGVANSIMLPHALAYNLPVAAREIATMAEAMGVDTRNLTAEQAAEAGIDAVRRLQADAKVPTRLRDTGLDAALLPAIAEHTLRDRGLFFNPRRTETAAPILDLLKQAW